MHWAEMLLFQFFQQVIQYMSLDLKLFFFFKYCLSHCAITRWERVRDKSISILWSFCFYRRQCDSLLNARSLKGKEKRKEHCIRSHVNLQMARQAVWLIEKFSNHTSSEGIIQFLHDLSFHWREYLMSSLISVDSSFIVVFLFIYFIFIYI